MKTELITSTEHTLGGSPRLDGRRLDVRHLIWGIIKYNNRDFKSYQDDFEVSAEQIRHAILYCKDEICELQGVPQSCNGCSKRFRKDIARWEDYVQEMGGIEKIATDGDPILKLGDDSMLLEDLEDHKKDFDGVNCWEIAKELHQKLKEEFNFPESYEQLLNE